MKPKNPMPREKAARLAAAAAKKHAALTKDLPRLEEPLVKQALQLNQSEIDILNLIASGKPPRNAGAIMQAIKLKLEHTITKPTVVEAKAAPVSVTIQTYGDQPAPTVQIDGDEGEDAGAEQAGPPAVQARGPILRKKEPEQVEMFPDPEVLQ